MSRYIDAEKLVYSDITTEDGEVIEVVKGWRVEQAPTVDAVPVVHGHWEIGDSLYVTHAQCSKCKRRVYESVEYKFCPWCGAKMDEVER